eukprot:gene19370-29828_t
MKRALLVVLVGCAALTTAGKAGEECEDNSILTDCGDELGCVESTCQCCMIDADCQTNRLSGRDDGDHYHKCSALSEPEDVEGLMCDKVCGHKDFFPVIKWDIVCGAIANYINYCMKKHPDFPRVKKPLIEYGVSLMIMPALLAGTSCGTLLDKVLPLWLITVLLFILLLALSIRTSLKARQAYVNERKAKKQVAEAKEKINKATEPDADEEEAAGGVPPKDQDPKEAPDATGYKQFPLIPLALTLAAWVTTALTALLKGGKGVDSLIPSIHCGNVGYWLVFFAFLIIMTVLTAAVRRHMLRTLAATGELAASKRKDDVIVLPTSPDTDNHPEKVGETDFPEATEDKEGEVADKAAEDTPKAAEDTPKAAEDTPAEAPKYEDLEVKWTRKNTILFPVICFFAGVGAGMLGIGGGMVVGPMLVELGLKPKVVAATSAYAVLVSASAASVQFTIMGLLYTDYSLMYLSCGFAATIIGQRLMDAVIKKLDLQSAIIIVIAGVTILATIALAYKSVVDLMMVIDKDMGFRELCH